MKRWYWLVITVSVVVLAWGAWGTWRLWNLWQYGDIAHVSPHVRAIRAPHLGSYEEARWSPDGQWIAAVIRTERADGFDYQLVLLHPDGTLAATLPTPRGVATIGVDNVLTWRSDGQLVIVADLSTMADVRMAVSPDRYALFLVDPQHPAQPPQLLRDNLAPIRSLDWAADGQPLLLSQALGGPGPIAAPSRDVGLTVYAAPASAIRLWQHHDTALSRPRWRRDGTSVLYEAELNVFDPKMVRSETQQDLVIRPWPSGLAQRIARSGCGLDAADWSPDGGWIIYRETCTGFQWGTQRMVVAPTDHPLDGTTACDEGVYYQTDWGPNNQVLGLSAHYPGPGSLYICGVSVDP